jgi:hypothetical protein
MQVITIEDVLSWSPCRNYQTREALLVITGGRESLTPEEVLDLDIPWEDRLWVLFNEPTFTAIELRLLACDFAEHVLSVWEDWAKEHAPEHMSAPRNLLRLIREFPDDPEKWATALAAAWEARLAAWIAGDNAGDNSDARDARAAIAALDSARYTGAGSAGGAAQAARTARAARKAEKNWQIEHLRMMLTSA